MAFTFCSLASGSSGNSYLIKSESTALIVDTGTAGKVIAEGLSFFGMAPSDIDGIFVTHEHIDHVKSIRMIARMAERARVYGSAATLDAIADKVDTEKLVIFDPYDTAIEVGDIVVENFPLSHDASDPTGYAFICDGKKISIITDTGCVTEEQFEKIAGSDILVIEANHEENILLMGKYPYELKKRILGEHGHLSNELAARCIARVIGESKTERMPKIVLAHLSRENNSPEIALTTVGNLLQEDGLYENSHYEMYVAMRDERSVTFTI